MKIRLAILESDAGYLKKIETAFNIRYADKLEIYTFTNESTAYERLPEEKADVFLASDAFDIDAGRIPLSCGFAYLVESGDIDKVRDQPAICKFQKAELIYKSILNIFSEKISSEIELSHRSDAGCSLIAFTSPAGGVGNSSAAAACAMYLAKRNKRVFYLNLERFGDSDVFFRAEGAGSFSEVIRAVKSRKKNLSVKIESVMKYDKGVAFFSGADLALDMEDINADETDELISALAMMGKFEYVIIDMDLTFSDKAVKVLGKCDRIVVVTDGSTIANEKTARAFTSLGVLEQQRQTRFLLKSRILYNRFSSRGSCKLEGSEVEELGGINRYEGYATGQLLQQLSEMSVFDGLM